MYKYYVNDVIALGLFSFHCVDCDLCIHSCLSNTSFVSAVHIGALVMLMYDVLCC
jgi:hypothetical protein